MEKYFNIQQVAKYLRITDQAVQRLLAGGKIPAIKTPTNVYIFRKGDVDLWLKSKRDKVKGMLETLDAL